MYNPEITQRAVDAANAAQLATTTPQADRWELVYHTPTEIAQAISYFSAPNLYDAERGKLLRALTGPEARFIENERRLCALDFRYYCHYAMIVDWQKQSVPFTPNIAQQIVLDLWGQLESRAMAISMIQLKARQLGVSTLTEIAVSQRVQFIPRSNAVVASSDPAKSRKVANMIAYTWKNMPWWLMPRVTKVSQMMPAEFGDLNTAISIQAGNQFNGLARGDTPNVAHLTELCEWPDPEQKVDAALLRAMHETPDVFLVLESTALGRGNWWHKTWLQSKHDWDLGRSRLCPVFLPWFTGTDIYPTATWLRARPVPLDWQPKDVTIKHAERARSYVLRNPLLFKFIAKFDRDWQIPRAQLWFYEVERDTASAKGILNHFLAEMPADDQEAFQSMKTAAINSEVLLTYAESTREPVGVYAIIGDGIPESLVPSRRHWRFDLPPINIACGKLLNNRIERYQFIPVEFTGYSDTDPSLRLFIYEHPQDLETYGLGVDTSDGIGLDSSAIEVARKGQLTRRDAQVAEFVSPFIHASQLWPMALAIGTYYSTISARTGTRTPCRVAIECRGNGEMVQLEMKKRGWSNFHPWLHYGDKKFPQPGIAAKQGVYTNYAYRMQMMDLMLTLIDEESILINSPWFVDEMRALERDETKQKLAAAAGEHDDRFMALGFILFSLHVLDIQSGNRDFSKYTRKLIPIADERDGAEPAYAVWQPPAQARDLPQRGGIPLSRRMSSHGGMGQTTLGHYRQILKGIGRERRG